jgi:hypothetical protein
MKFVADSWAAQHKPYSGRTEVAQAADDLAHGLIDKPTYDAIVRKSTYIAPSGGADAGAWEVVDMPDGTKAQRNRRTGQLSAMPGGSTSPSDIKAGVVAKIQRGEKITRNDAQAYSMLSQSDPYMTPMSVDEIEKQLGGFAGENYQPAPQVKTEDDGGFSILNPSTWLGGASPATAQPAAPAVTTLPGAATPTQAAPGNRVTVRSHAEWEALPPGTPYVTQDGKTGIR